MSDKELDLSQVECDRCGNCCPSLTCKHFEREGEMATCKDHDNNVTRVGCILRPIDLYNEGIACRAVEIIIKRKGPKRELIKTSSGQVIYADSEMGKIISKHK